MIKIIGAAAFALALTGCATIIDGQHQTMTLVTKGDLDKRNTECDLHNNKGAWTTDNKESIMVRRAHSSMIVSCENETQEGEIVLESTASVGFMIANFFLWDLCTISCLVDHFTGSLYEYPLSIRVTMENKFDEQAAVPVPAIGIPLRKKTGHAVVVTKKGKEKVERKGILQLCDGSSKKTGVIYKISGSEVNVRKGPGVNFSKIINQKATEILRTTQYITVDNSVTIYEECTQGEWSKIRVTDPDWLSKSHRGWVSSKFLRGKNVDSSGAELFSEEDFYFDKNTRPYQSIIVAGVNKVHRENSRCKDIDVSSAYISGSKGNKANPVFFVTCGKGQNAFNAFFSKSDVEKDNKLSAKVHISKSNAISLCENHAKENAVHPSTVDFSVVMDLSVYDAPNGRTRVTSTFTAKNSFNLKLEHKISCLLDSNGLIEANISEVE